MQYTNTGKHEYTKYMEEQLSTSLVLLLPPHHRHQQKDSVTQ